MARVITSFRKTEKRIWKGRVGQLARALILHKVTMPYSRLSPFAVSALVLIGCLAVVSDDTPDDPDGNNDSS